MKKFILILLSILSIAVVKGLVSFLYMEQPGRYYEIHTDELYAGGWVPRQFPKDITNIYEQHDIDTNHVWLRFDRGQQAVSTEGMKKLSIKEKEKLQLQTPLFSSWWFDGLIEQQPANDAALYADVFIGSCGRGSSFLALSLNRQTVYWWCQSE